ncbi:hypothetical protein C7S18_22635 [Ahniella affigens]|uniref:Uncharacterized protein n=1 Tax=Ahniella affigens TaxID=2021234 RepID=A0A2P1PY76_9GAMM|nr:hypothetical protein C7S18_22635 [Ahniella affigens]
MRWGAEPREPRGSSKKGPGPTPIGGRVEGSIRVQQTGRQASMLQHDNHRALASRLPSLNRSRSTQGPSQVPVCMPDLGAACAARI